MTDAEAEALLTKLREHYGQPVMPVSRYCDALTTWARIMMAKSPAPWWADNLRQVLLNVSKSNLLARLIYGGEKLREHPCPQHKGHWCGVGLCDHGCHETGWLPEVHACEPVTVQGWGESPTAVRCQRCGGLPEAGVHEAGAPSPKEAA